jgi:chemotaxis protein CheD
MNRLIRPIDLFLQPGEFYFGEQYTRIRTLLGSCVAITLWHPEKRIGGMCHYMLPYNRLKNESQVLNGKYAEDVMKMFVKEITAICTTPSEYQVKVFGGGEMFAGISGLIPCLYQVNQLCFKSSSCQSVACKNVSAANYLLKKYGFNTMRCDLGGIGHRKVIFEVVSGDVWLQKGNTPHLELIEQ